jgi:hypothetical protein
LNCSLIALFFFKDRTWSIVVCLFFFIIAIDCGLIHEIRMVILVWIGNVQLFFMCQLSACCVNVFYNPGFLLNLAFTRCCSRYYHKCVLTFSSVGFSNFAKSIGLYSMMFTRFGRHFSIHFNEFIGIL